MPTDDARQRDTDRATAFAQQGTVVVPEEAEDAAGTSEEGHDDAGGEPGERDWDRIDAEDVIPDEYLNGGTHEEDDTPGTGPVNPSETPHEPGDPDGRDFSDMELEDLYDPEETLGDAEDVYDDVDDAGTGTDSDVPIKTPDDDEDIYGGEDDTPSDIPLAEFDPGTGTAPVDDTGTGDADGEDDGAALHELSGARDDYLAVLEGTAEKVLTGESPFEGWQIVAGRAADAAGDYVAVLEPALDHDMETDSGAARTAEEAAAVFGTGTYDPGAFTPVDLGLSGGQVFGRVLYAFQQEFSEQGGMETVFEGSTESGGDAVIDTLSEKLSNYTDWANGGHGNPVDASSIADLYQAATDEKGLEKVAEAAWNRGTLQGEVRSQAYVDKHESMEKLASFTAQEVENGLEALDAHIADTDYSDSWVMNDDTDIETYVSAAVDAVTDGFRTVMTAARLWNHQEQELADDAEKKERYDDAAAFFPGSDHARQNRDSLAALAAEGATMMEAGRDALLPALDAVEDEFAAWERMFEGQEVGALLDHTGEPYDALEAAHDAYTDAKNSMEAVAGGLDSVRSYADAGDRAVDAVDDIDAATAYLAELGTSVVDEMDLDGLYGHALVGEALKEDYLPAHTPQGTREKRDDLNQALRTFAGYTAR